MRRYMSLLFICVSPSFAMEGKMLPEDFLRYPHAILVSWAAVKCWENMHRGAAHCFPPLAELSLPCKLRISSWRFIRSWEKVAREVGDIIVSEGGKHGGLSKSSVLRDVMCAVTSLMYFWHCLQESLSKLGVEKSENVWLSGMCRAKY